MSRGPEASGSSLRVRPATGSDFGLVLGMLEAAALPTEGVPSTLQDFFVAQDTDGIVGAIGLERYARAALLRSAVVEPRARGIGVGEALIHRALDHAHQGGVDSVYLLTTTAEQYFPRFGFIPIPREEVPAEVKESVEFRSACPASATVMRKMFETR